MSNNHKQSENMPSTAPTIPPQTPSKPIAQGPEKMHLQTSQLGPSLKRRTFQPQAFDPASRESWSNRKKNKERWCQISVAKIGDIIFWLHTTYLISEIFRVQQVNQAARKSWGCEVFRRRGSSTKRVQNCSDLKSMAEAKIGPPKFITLSCFFYSFLKLFFMVYHIVYYDSNCTCSPIFGQNQTVVLTASHNVRPLVITCLYHVDSAMFWPACLPRWPNCATVPGRSLFQAFSSIPYQRFLNHVSEKHLGNWHEQTFTYAHIHTRC